MSLLHLQPKAAALVSSKAAPTVAKVLCGVTSVQDQKTRGSKPTNGLRHTIGAWEGAVGRALFRWGTLALLLVCPQIAQLIFHVLEDCEGSALRFLQQAWQGGLPYLMAAMPQPSLLALQYIAVFGALQAALQLLLPGKTFLGPVTPMGNTPRYKANGFAAYTTTIVLFFATWWLGFFDPAAVYDLMGSLLATSNILSLVICVLLVIKGLYAPSSSDNGTTGSIIFDFYSGVELFPRLGQSFDIKTWTNCRMGMMSWAVLPLCYAAKQAQLGGLSNSMVVSVFLMEAYVAKFFLWETGYWSSMDITHDRAGFYLCWGCLVWVPAVYTSPAMYLVRHPHQLPAAAAGAILLTGLACIWINYDSDRQRHEFRRTGGKKPIWGKAPRIIKANYSTGDGQSKSSLLLASGWWGLSRHFHFLPEVLAAFFWSAPALFNHLLPYFYVLFLSLLLLDRAYRHDSRCKAKYGKHWDVYCRMVPYKIIPYIF